MDKLKDLKMSKDLKDRVKMQYKEEKKKPVYKIRKLLDYELEISAKTLVAVLIVAILLPAVDTINKFKDLTENEILISMDDVVKENEKYKE